MESRCTASILTPFTQAPMGNIGRFSKSKVAEQYKTTA
jgi:hypothetical protein